MSLEGFFGRHPQEDISIRGASGKSPMFFRDLHMMGAIFAAPLSRLRAALPRGLSPLALPFGRGLVAVHCLEHKDTDIGPYNEVALSIALRPLRRRGAHGWVESLPVTTDVSVHGGLDFFNFPKYKADISFRETASHRVCTLRDAESRDLILEFQGRRIATRSRAPGNGRPAALYAYSQISGHPHRALFLLDQIEGGARLLRGAVLRLGPHPRSRPFRDLGLGPAVHYLFAPRCRAILFKPEAL